MVVWEKNGYETPRYLDQMRKASCQMRLRNVTV